MQLKVTFLWAKQVKVQIFPLMDGSRMPYLLRAFDILIYASCPFSSFTYEAQILRTFIVLLTFVEIIAQVLVLVLLFY